MEFRRFTNKNELGYLITNLIHPHSFYMLLRLSPCDENFNRYNVYFFSKVIVPDKYKYYVFALYIISNVCAYGTKKKDI